MYPKLIRKLLKFLVHNDILKNKIIKEIKDPNEKLNEDKFIQPTKIEKLNTITCQI